jgi:hypothetical protein
LDRVNSSLEKSSARLAWSDPPGERLSRRWRADPKISGGREAGVKSRKAKPSKDAGSATRKPAVNEEWLREYDAKRKAWERAMETPLPKDQQLSWGTQPAFIGPRLGLLDQRARIESEFDQDEVSPRTAPEIAAQRDEDRAFAAVTSIHDPGADHDKDAVLRQLVAAGPPRPAVIKKKPGPKNRREINREKVTEIREAHYGDERTREGFATSVLGVSPDILRAAENEGLGSEKLIRKLLNAAKSKGLNIKRKDLLTLATAEF